MMSPNSRVDFPRWRGRSLLQRRWVYRLGAFNAVHAASESM
jgi:hypothetical protein